jgi:hypothetical protein
MARFGQTVCLAAALLGAGPATPQYFGQNKVRYEALPWRVLKTEHFEIHYYSRQTQAVEQFGRMAERWYARLSQLLEHQLPPGQPIILYDSHTAFRGTTVIPGLIGETTGGVTEGLRRRVVLPMAGPLAETDHVLGHELVHAFQYDITTPRDTKGIAVGTPGAVALPLWFIEGMAEYLSLGALDPHTAMWMRDAVAAESFPSLSDLDQPRYFPYRFGQAFWAYVAGKYGDEVVGRMLKVAAQTRSVEAAIGAVLKVSPDELGRQWREALVERCRPVLEAARGADEFGRLVFSEKRRGGRLNLSPVLSPDGRKLLFYSERDSFSVDLYIADLDRGARIGRLTNTAVDPHLDSLQFVNSAGAWSPDGRLVAFAAIRAGRPELCVYEVSSRRIRRRIRLPELSELLHLSFAPDGRRIAVSAMAGGLTDLFVVDLANGSLRRLTDDAFADLQPAWSPDGETIAFVTDRFTTRLETLAFGDYRIGLYRIATGAIEPAAGFLQGKHINPNWSADGSGLYFVSDADGVSNIYRLELATGDLRRVTNLRTGVTGIGALSPAFSVAGGSGRLAFTAFRNGRYEIYLIDSAEQLAGLPVGERAPSRIAALLAPREKPVGAVEQFLSDAAGGLPDAAAFQKHPYRPRLSLDYVAAPSIGVGFGAFGPVVGGGTALYWSDLLGQHLLMATLESTSLTSGSLLNNLGGMVGYQNQKSRWNWGLAGGQLPYVTGGYSASLSAAGGRTVLVEQSLAVWQINREATAIFSYPFSRARRIELTGGYLNIAFDAKAEVAVTDVASGRLLALSRETLPMPEALHMGTASAAFVHDTSVFGGTSPVAGARYRIEFGAAAGSLSYTHGLLDYRRYLRLPSRLTLAGRLLHYGRYGGGAEDARFQDIFLGYPSLVRGYSPGSFGVNECGNEAGRCPVFERLFGTRMAVANAELRLPVFGALGVVSSPNVPPVETALFYDAGLAWRRADDRAVVGGGRRPVASYGVSLRVNLFGFAVAQISYVQPQHRPLKSWHWEVALIPGF